MDDLKGIIKLNRELFVHENKNYDKTTDIDWSFSEAHKKYYTKSIQKNFAVVALVDNKVVGYLVGTIIKAESYRNVGKIAELDDMFVSEKFRSEGIGAKLVAEFKKWAKSKKVKRIKVFTSTRNNKAIEFYRRNGFDDYGLILEGELR